MAVEWHDLNIVFDLCNIIALVAFSWQILELIILVFPKFLLFLFAKTLDHAISNMQKMCTILNNLMCNWEKLKMCKFLWTGCMQKFLCKTCAVSFITSQAFQKAKFNQNLTSGSGSKQRFILLQEKEVIQAVCLRTQAVSFKFSCNKQNLCFDPLPLVKFW